MKSRSFNLLVILALFLSLLGTAVTVTPAYATGIVVNSNADNTLVNLNGNGTCDLREAITNANNNDQSGSTECTAGAGTDTITFAADYTITLAGSQLPAVNTNIIINGNGATKTIIQANAAANTATYRVFEVSSGGNLTLDKLTLQNGKTAASGGGVSVDAGGTLTVTNSTLSNNIAGTIGGGIFNIGTATITNSTFAGNSTPFDGGGIFNSGTLNVTNSTFSSNTANEGSGIYNYTGGTVTATDSTFSGNSAVDNGGGIYSNGTVNVTDSTFTGNNTNIDAGAGIYISSGVLNLKNSTFFGNSAGDGGGAIAVVLATANVTNSTFYGNTTGYGGGAFFNYGTLNITNSTISGNQAINRDGGGIFAGSGSSTTLLNTIVANNPSDSNCWSSGTFSANSSNLDSDGTCDSATTSASINLGSLQDNGGPTQTMALLAGSAAIDTGNSTTCANAPVSGKDQRGVTRPQGAGCDIGAFETGPIIPVVTASNPSANAVLTSLSSITVVFNQDMLDNATADGAENVSNYILVERGSNGIFNTQSCNGGVVSDDVQQTISTASYNSAGFITNLTLASPLTAGTYRLFVCGTTSVWSAAGLELNNGASDYTVDFTIAPTATGSPNTSTESTTASVLPKTGFAPKKITSLPAQPATLDYAKLGNIALEIPSLNVKSTIVGVPQANGEWDVTWLGNDIGWLNGTAFPTWTGNSVLTAHVTNASGLEGPFAALKSLRYGDQIIVHMGGVKYIYEVRNTRLSRPYSTNFAFESKQDASYLTLITCQGYNPLNESYLFRRVVRAVLIEVK